ncbi:unnamed protein product [Callosobruchus maculatus]|uniref:Uncharacterized protein n=1 Tax=Callosobruchus maculatus TaxID=64391 RepID=A0A653CWL1_CALMS|nr:unnamed protein product [Callosobruchus maculatus]
MVVVTLNNAMFPFGGAKPEKNDVEITAMAEKIRENNQKVMKVMKLNTQSTLQKLLSKPSEEVAPTVQEPSEDYASTQGQFGWTTIADKNFPYLIRSGDRRYVCKRMLMEQRIFDPYLQVFTEEVYNCYNIKTIKVTKAEAALLNEINIKHCDGCYGNVRFGDNDVLILLDEVNELKKFFEFCHSRLIKKENDKQPCGFIQVSSQNNVPYVRSGDITYVPLFYFEGDCMYLEERAVELGGWDLCYLKLACKLQGIRKELFDKPTLQVVDMELVKQFFAPGTLFEEFWLFENKTSHLVRTQTAVLSAKPTPTVVQNQQRIQPRQQSHVPVTSVPTYQYYANPEYTRGQPTMVTSHMPVTTYVPYQNNQNGCARPRAPANRRNVHPNPYPVATIYQTTTIASSYTTTANTNGYRSVTPNVIPSLNQGYNVYQTSFDGRYLRYCVNVQPSTPSPLAITVDELAVMFSVNINTILDVLRVMGIPVTPANMYQQQALSVYKICNPQGLVLVDSIKENIKRIEYILNRK